MEIKQVYITPEEYATREGISLKTVYNRINSEAVKTTKMFKKTLIIV